MSSSSSTNANNQGSGSSYYDADVDESHALRYVVPTTSNLSRGIKGTVQRMFTGEPLNNLCNVYVYNTATELWNHEAKIEGSSGEDFGRSLDGTDDAEMVAIGGPGTWFGSRSDTTGRVRVYTKDGSGTGWSQRGSDITKSNGGGFGHAVALSHQDGSILVIGAPFHNTLTPSGFSYPVSEGKVYVYKWNSSSSEYEEEQVISSLSGTLTSSTPADWKNFYFGYSLGISNYGKSIIIGEPSFRDIWYNTRHVQQGTNYKYTGNAHVYYNSTLTTGGTTWTSNVSVTEQIGVTGIGTTDDTQPTKVRWMDGVGTSVDITRKGDLILAGAPFSYGTSNTTPQIHSGRIYTLNYNTLTNAWDELGTDIKHITSGEACTLLGYSTRFDGSGQRIVAGAPQSTDHIQYYKGKVFVFDWNGDQWVSFPGQTAEVHGWNTDGTYWTVWQHKFGECVSIDGEGEMISIGNNQHHLDLHNTSIGLRPSVFSTNDIEYIGDGGSNGNINDGGSNIWVYNIQQSIRVKGNFTVGGFVQAVGIAVGTEDDSDTTQKSIYFGGTKSDNSYELTVIENRVYESNEKSELLLFKGNDNADSSGGGTYGPDRIRLKGGQIAFDLNSGYDRTQEDIRAVMHRNAGGAGMLGINVTSPSEVIDVVGKIKCSQGFIGNGTEITGLDLHHITNFTSAATEVAGSAANNIDLGELTATNNLLFPDGAMTSNTGGVSGYTISASIDASNVWKAFNDDTTNDSSNRWNFADSTVYSNSSNRGIYMGSVEKVPGYKGEWFEVQMPSKMFIQKVEIYTNSRGSLPRILHTFGSNDGVDYYLIHTTSDLGYFWGTSNAYNEIFDRSSSINTSTDTKYNRYLFIINYVSGNNQFYYQDIKITGTTTTYETKIKLDKTGKIGIGTSSPSAPLHVVASGNANPENNGIYVYNSGTASTEDAIVSVRTGTTGGNGGNPYISFDVAGHAGWSWGMDNADSQHRMKLGANWNSLTSNTKLAIGHDGKVGINHSTPDSTLHISSSSGQTITLDSSTYTSMIHMNRGSGNWYMTTDNTTTWDQNFHWHANTSQSGNPVKEIMWWENNTASAGTAAIRTFTGQHMSSIVDVTPTNVSNCIGLIVSSNQNDYMTINGGTPLKGAKNIHVNEAIPVVKISTKAQDKACFGVISSGEDPNESGREQRSGRIVGVFHKESGDNRVYVNSLGEGGIWVVNTNGNLEAGDYITTSNVSGYGMKQTSEFLANYTVAKITMDCNFNPGQVPVKQIKKVSATNTYYVRSTDNDTCTETFYNTLDDETKALYTQDVRTEMVNDLDSNGVFQWEDTSETELAYTIRYLDANGIETTQENAVHIAAFVGCTYHCG